MINWIILFVLLFLVIQQIRRSSDVCLIFSLIFPFLTKNTKFNFISTVWNKKNMWKLTFATEFSILSTTKKWMNVEFFVGIQIGWQNLKIHDAIWLYSDCWVWFRRLEPRIWLWHLQPWKNASEFAVKQRVSEMRGELIKAKATNYFLSQLAGVILTGNELSQISLALILTYFGGQRNRPRWIAIGMVFSSISCFILASPHFIYGAGDEALKYTKEYGLNYEVIASKQNWFLFFLSDPQNMDNWFLFYDRSVEYITNSTIKTHQSDI